MKKIKSFLTAAVFICALICVHLCPSVALAQTAAPTSPLFTGLSQALDLNDTNSLVNANEVNVTPEFKWNSATSEPGGALSVDWWVTDQQGAFFGFEEYRTRESYFSLGYQARTVFKGLEISLGVGTRQSNDDPLGDVKMFLRPTLTRQLYQSGDWDLRFTLGCDVLNAGKPNPFVGLTLRALKF